jgi:hypothetical protein
VHFGDGERTAPSENNAASIAEKLKSFHFRLTAKCPHCNYSGLMGWNEFKLPMSKWLYVLLAIVAAPIALVVFITKKGYLAHCPNCGQLLSLRKTEARPVKGPFGDQYYDANGEKVSRAGVLALSFKLAGKWLLFGATGLLGLLVFLVLVGLALDKLGIVPKETSSTAVTDQDQAHVASHAPPVKPEPTPMTEKDQSNVASPPPTAAAPVSQMTGQTPEILVYIKPEVKSLVEATGLTEKDIEEEVQSLLTRNHINCVNENRVLDTDDWVSVGFVPSRSGSSIFAIEMSVRNGPSVNNQIIRWEGAIGLSSHEQVSNTTVISAIEALGQDLARSFNSPAYRTGSPSR